jgi:DNA polymerase I
MRMFSEAIELENSIAPILARQCAYGIEFDVKKAQELEANLIAEKVRIRQELQEVFKPRVLNKGEVFPKASNSKYGTKKGCVYTKVQFQEYNPASRQQTIDRLCKEFGWKPEEFTDKGNPELDEEIIESLPFKELKPLKDFYTTNKRLGQLSDGTKAWLKVVKDDNRIYGAVMQSGTVTGRMSHHSPNLAQVPATDKPWGKECRELFRVPEGKIMIGCDADALEMRVLAGYLSKIDGGKFIKTVLEGKKEEGTDMHTLNMYAYGIEQYEGARDCSKTLFYASLYGAKDPKLGLILQQWGVTAQDYVQDFDGQFKSLKQWAARKSTGFSDKFLECLLIGKTARAKYGERLPDLPKLIKDVQDTWKKNGFLKGLDGRKLYPRSEHSAFNTLLQSAGAIIMKKALHIADTNIQKMNYVPGIDYEFILNIHDEWQIELNVDNSKGICDIIDIVVKSIQDAGEFFKFPCPMKGNASKGLNWSETH